MSLRQGGADDFFVVAHEDALAGEGGVGPDDGAAGVGGGGFEEMGAADLLVAFGGELGDDEVALLIGEEEAVGVFDDEGIGPADERAAGGGSHGFPEALAGFELEAAELAVAADAVDVAVLNEGGADKAVEGVGVFLP